MRQISVGHGCRPTQYLIQQGRYALKLMDTYIHRRKKGRPASDAELQPLIRAEQIHMLFANAISTSLTAAALAIGMAWLIRKDVETTALMAWLLIKFVVLGARLVHVRRYYSAPDPVHDTWYRSFIVLLLLDGLIWGAVAWWLKPVGDDVVAFSDAFLMGLAAAGAFVLHADLAANAVFITPVLIPMSLSLIRRGDEFGWLVGMGGLGFLIVLLIESHRSERRLVELLWLRYITDRVAHERAAALKLAEQHSAFKSQFLATMSHEMRTPLHGILGLTRQIRRIEPLAESRRKLELVERSGQHLLTVINDVLDLSKIEAGRIQIEKRAFDLATLINDAAELAAVQAADKGLALDIDLQLPRPCWVEGDSARISQVLHNLLGNAVKFTEIGKVTMHASRKPNSDDVCFVIEDSGIGIAAEETERIFDAFHQADRSYNRRFEGAGLGLSISRELSRAMGGDIVCASVAGLGSTFTFTLPLPVAPEPRLPQAAQVPAGRETEARSTPLAENPTLTSPIHLAGGSPPQGIDFSSERRLQGRVVMAEDNPVNALVAQAVLNGLGLQVEVVDDGQAAVQRLREGIRPDLILMDCQMPVMDGFEAARHIRAHEARTGQARVPIVALTANAMESDRQRCLDAGMDAHLPKPFQDEQLIGLLQQILAMRPSGAPNSSMDATDV